MHTEFLYCICGERLCWRRGVLVSKIGSRLYHCAKAQEVAEREHRLRTDLFQESRPHRKRENPGRA